MTVPETWDIVSSVANVIGGIGGIAGIVALVQTHNGNKIAEDANSKSDEANMIARKALAHDIEDSHVDWEADWNEDSKSVVLTNVGKNVAHDVAIIVNAVFPGSGERFHRSATDFGDVADGHSVNIEIPEAVDDRRLVNGNLAGSFMGRYMMISQGVHWTCVLGCDVTWKTGEGFPKIKHLEVPLS